MSFISSRNHYFSITNILATEERIPVHFQQNISYLGVLDPSLEDTTLLAGTSLELPYWLASSLIHEEGVGQSLPKIFLPSCRDVVLAAPSAVNLAKLSNNYYEFGKLLSSMRQTDGKEICDLLVQTMVDRFRQIFDWAQCTGDSELELFEKLDSLEMGLLQRGKTAQTDLNKWMKEGVKSIEMADMVLKHRKRQLINEEFF